MRLILLFVFGLHIFLVSPQQLKLYPVKINSNDLNEFVNNEILIKLAPQDSTDLYIQINFFHYEDREDKHPIPRMTISLVEFLKDKRLQGISNSAYGYCHINGYLVVFCGELKTDYAKILNKKEFIRRPYYKEREKWALNCYFPVYEYTFKYDAGLYVLEYVSDRELNIFRRAEREYSIKPSLNDENKL